MRCKFCGGLIVFQPAYTYNPERHYCVNCGREVEESEIKVVREKRSRVARTKTLDIRKDKE